MTEEPEERCDADDIVCQADRLAKMKNLRAAFDDEEFKKKYPSLVELSGKLDETIKEEEKNLQQRLGACNLPIDILKTKEEHEPPGV